MRRLHGSCSSAWAIGLLLAITPGSVVHAEPGHTFAPLTEAQRQAVRAAIPAHASSPSATSSRMQRRAGS